MPSSRAPTTRVPRPSRGGCASAAPTSTSSPTASRPAPTSALVDLDVSGPAARFGLARDGDVVPLALRVPGAHNALDAAAAWTAGAWLGLDPACLAEGLAGFGGTRRRFETKGFASGVRVVDDYAHHPTKVAAVLRAVRGVSGDGRVLVIFQPHLYSRTRLFAAEFGAALGLADEVVVLDVYGAREDPEPGVTGELVARAVPLPAGCVAFEPDPSDGGPPGRRPRRPR